MTFTELRSKLKRLWNFNAANNNGAQLMWKICDTKSGMSLTTYASPCGEHRISPTSTTLYGWNSDNCKTSTPTFSTLLSHCSRLSSLIIKFKKWRISRDGPGKLTNSKTWFKNSYAPFALLEQSTLNVISMYGSHVRWGVSIINRGVVTLRQHRR